MLFNIIFSIEQLFYSQFFILLGFIAKSRSKLDVYDLISFLLFPRFYTLHFPICLLSNNNF